MKQLLITTALLALLATPAFAHAHLAKADPADGAVVTPGPSSLTLSFTEGLSLTFSGVTLTGPAGAVPLQPATLAPGDGTVLLVPLATALPSGAYAVDWRALSTDGHKTTGHYAFTVK